MLSNQTIQEIQFWEAIQLGWLKRTVHEKNQNYTVDSAESGDIQYIGHM